MEDGSICGGDFTPSIYTKHLDVDNLKGRIFAGVPWAVRLFLYIGDVHNRIHPKLLHRWHPTIWTKRFSGLPMIPLLVSLVCICIRIYAYPPGYWMDGPVRNQCSYTIANKPLASCSIELATIMRLNVLQLAHFISSSAFFHLTPALCRLEVYNCTYLRLSWIAEPHFELFYLVMERSIRRLALLFNAGILLTLLFNLICRSRTIGGWQYLVLSRSFVVW